MQWLPQSKNPFQSPFQDDDHHRRHKMDIEQPLDFSVKSPGSFGDSERDFCSPHDHHSAPRSSKSRGSGGSLIKDEQYWLRREKNNAAAKRSRDARRQKEEQTKHENQILREENEKLKYSLRALQDHVRVCPVLGRPTLQDDLER